MKESVCKCFNTITIHKPDHKHESYPEGFCFCCNLPLWSDRKYIKADGEGFCSDHCLETVVGHIVPDEDNNYHY